MQELKLCSKCGRELLLSAFYKKKKGKYGVEGRCKECVRAEVKARNSNPKTREENRRKAKQRTKEYRQELRRREWAKKGKIYQTLEARKAVAKEKSALRRIKRKVRAAQSRRPIQCRDMTNAEWFAYRYKNCPEFNLKVRVRNQIQKIKRKEKYANMIRCALKRDGDSPTIARTFGYSIAELREHLESLFVDGMTWSLFLKGEIHIDHIKPIAAHDLSIHEEFIACWSLSNLQPLWAKDNWAKSDKWGDAA